MPDRQETFKAFDADLLDLHLGQVSAEQADALRRRIAEDPRAARESEAIESVMGALHAWRAAPDMPADLVSRTLARVKAAGPAMRVVRSEDAADDSRQGAASRSASGDERDDAARIVKLSSLRDVLAIAAMIVLFIGLGVPSVLRVRGLSQRTACSANLAQLGQGLAAYASTFGDSLPFTGFNPLRASWQSGGDASVERVPNRRHMYPMLTIGIVRDPARFICPSLWHTPMAASQVKQYSDFPESRNVSYAYQNMAGVRPTLGGNPDLPIIADDNPLFDDGHPLGLSYGPSANSRSHGGDGQNVLTLGGRVRFFDTPNCGVDGDNIWTLRDVTQYTGREGPRFATDSHLLK